MKRKARPFQTAVVIALALSVPTEIAALGIRQAAAKYHTLGCVSFADGKSVALNPWITDVIHGRSPVSNTVLFSSGCGHITTGRFFALSWCYVDCSH